MAEHMHRHESQAAAAPKTYGRAFAIGIGLNVAFIAVEVTFGLIANSTALLADAGHNLSDVLALIAAWSASMLSARPPSARYTYGLRGSTILAALFNALLLLVAVGAIAWEAIQRFFDPAPVEGITVMIVAGIGVLINGATAWLFASGRAGDLNIRGAFLHMAADAAVSAGVIIAGGAILITGWLWIDPVTSLAIAAMIVWSTWGLLRDSVSMSLAGVPRQIDLQEVRGFLAALPQVHSVHDLHVWPMSTAETALTCHVVVPSGHPGDAFLVNLTHDLNARFGIAHATIQIETDPETRCVLAPERVV